MPPHAARSRHLPLPYSLPRRSAAAIAPPPRLSLSIASSPFSTHVSSQQKPMRIWPKSKPKMSESTKIKKMGSIVASAEDRREWTSNVERRVSYAWSNMPLAMQLNLALMGFEMPQSRDLCNDVGQWLRNGCSISAIDSWLSAENGRSYPLPVPERVLMSLGVHCIDHAPEWEKLGFNLLKIASERGSEASKLLCKYEYVDHYRFQASASARRKVAELALEEKDWEAMTLHVNSLVREGKKSVALACAKRLCEVTTAAQLDYDLNDNNYLSLPWKTWYEATGPGDVEEKRRAVQLGVEVWNDPEASVLLAAGHGERGSRQWLEAITNGAMAGHLWSMQRLGLHHLGLHGWYESKKRVSHSIDTKLGFEWLELSTLFEEPIREAHVWAGLAVLLREHQDLAGGMKYLQKGLKQINEKVISDSVEPTKRNQALIEKRMALEELYPLVQNWNVNVLTHRSLSGSEQRITSRMFFETLTP